MTAFTGKITTTGKSEAIRLEKALFRAHPEFRQKAAVRAQVIAPGQLLVSVVDEPADDDPEADPLIDAFLGFLAADIGAHPERVAALSEGWIAEASDLVRGVQVADDEVIPDDAGL